MRRSKRAALFDLSVALPASSLSLKLFLMACFAAAKDMCSVRAIPDTIDAGECANGDGHSRSFGDVAAAKRVFDAMVDAERDSVCQCDGQCVERTCAVRRSVSRVSSL